MRLFVEWDGNGSVLPKRLIFEAAERRWGRLSRSAAELEEWYVAEYPFSYRPDPRIDELLSTLVKQEIPWGIITNGPEFQRDKVRHLGFDRIADVILVSATFGHRKPEPEIFLKGMRLLSVEDPERCLFVGDSPDHVVAHAVEIMRLFA